MNQSEGYYTVPQAAKIFKVTEKTIRNYIERRILIPEKWNGQWRFAENHLMEILEKKFGKLQARKIPPIDIESETVSVSREDYDAQQQRLGQLATEAQWIQELKQEVKSLQERLIQLEASAASGWAEARSVREDLKGTREHLRESEVRENQAREEIGWLRRELTRLQDAQQASDVLLRTLKRQNAELAEQAHVRAIAG